MGNIIDHTKPGKEKYRPWLLKAGIPVGIVMVLMFTVPKIGDVGQIILGDNNEHSSDSSIIYGNGNPL